LDSLGIMKWNPENDGIDHINVYSNGKTELGRLLSNFPRTPFELEDFGQFASVEAFWYYILTGNENLRSLSGIQAKNLGKESLQDGIEDQVPQEFLKMAYIAKLEQNGKVRDLLLKSTLPLTHYYVFKNGYAHSPEEYQWTVEL